jgi:hypothetical protein
MFSHKADGPLTVHVPGPNEDRPAWGKVGALAAAGFVLGIAWPKLAGVRLGPSVPADGASAASMASSSMAASSAGDGVAAAAPAASKAVAAASAVASSRGAPPAMTAAAVAGPPSVSVSRGAVSSCRTSDGDRLKGSDCGALPGLDAVVRPRLRELAACPDAAGLGGSLHLIVRPDFRRGALSVDVPHNPGISPSDGLLACAKNDLAGAGAALGNVPHDHPRYSVSYTVTFGAGGAASSTTTGTTPAAAVAAPAARADGETLAADGSAQVVWDVAIIRDAPRSGKIVARLPRGTPIRLGAVKDGWYPVRYGDGFAGEGWVYRGAVGR